ncbi:MAG: hypothetical protein ACYC6G_08225 [Desulfobaccales bacterium]
MNEFAGCSRSRPQLITWSEGLSLNLKRHRNNDETARTGVVGSEGPEFISKMGRHEVFKTGDASQILAFRTGPNSLIKTA